MSIRSLLVLLLLGNMGVLFAQAPTAIQLSNNSLAENEELYTFIGTLTATDPDQATGHQFELTICAPDNRYFRIQNDSLFSFFSFDYERGANYQIQVKVTDASQLFYIQNLPIQITNLTGKYDNNGIADADLAAKYPQVNVGDYIFFNGAGGVDAIYAQNASYPNISYPNKVLIKGDDYLSVRINGQNLNGNNLQQQVIITNFLGQVKVKQGYVAVSRGQYWRLTGQYDPALGLGSPYYRGCDQNGSTVDFGYSAGKFGIHVTNEWVGESTNQVQVGNVATDFEIDHLEIADGGFAGLMIKYDDNGTHRMDNVRIHHLYIHDIGSEGMYIGSTQAEPQHLFENLHIHHCAVLRTGGEAIQIGQQSQGCVVEHNILWGAFDWLSPFNRWQDNVLQLDARNGAITIRNNVLMGAAGNAFSAFNRTKPNLTPNGQPIRIENNLVWCSRGSSAAYQGGPGDNVTPWIWAGNYWGKAIFDYNRVYTGETARNHFASIGMQNTSVHDTLINNVFDATRANLYARWGGGSVQIYANNNTQAALADPAFRHFLTAPDALNYLTWTRWTARIGEAPAFPASGTNKGQPVTYTVGDVVQHHVQGGTRFYRCLQTHSLQEPSPEGNAYWELLTWSHEGQLSYLPPDDVRFDVGSFYYTQNIGLQSPATGLVVDAGADREVFLPVSSLVLEGNAYVPTGSISSFGWSQISGTPLSATGQSTAQLTLTNPPMGTYGWELTASSSTGASGKDTVWVTVRLEPQGPMADAGGDVYLGLPTTSTPLDGSGSSDADGVIARQTWRVLDAPGHMVGTPVSINFTDNATTAASPWNNTNGTTTAGYTISNLTDNAGTASTIQVELLDNWGGTNALGMVTGNNSGVFPDKVLEASYWFQTGIHRLAVRGLTPNGLYHFEFLGSRDGGGNRTTIYTIDGQSVALDAAYNTQNTVDVLWAQADATGTLEIVIEKASGASYGYLNALVITPTELTLSNADQLLAQLANLQLGQYWLELTVEDDDCLSHRDTILVQLDQQLGLDPVPAAAYGLSPNPTTGLVYLEQLGAVATAGSYRLYGAQGQLLVERSWSSSREAIDLGAYPAGVYWVQVVDARGTPLWRAAVLRR